SWPLLARTSYVLQDITGHHRLRARPAYHRTRAVAAALVLFAHRAFANARAETAGGATRTAREGRSLGRLTLPRDGRSGGRRRVTDQRSSVRRRPAGLLRGLLGDHLHEVAETLRLLQATGPHELPVQYGDVRAAVAHVLVAVCVDVGWLDDHHRLEVELFEYARWLAQSRRQVALCGAPQAGVQRRKRQHRTAVAQRLGPRVGQVATCCQVMEGLGELHHAWADVPVD